MKCIIAGGRDFNDYHRLEKVMDECPYTITEVVCGKAKGADSLGELWALSRNIPVKYFIPDWNGLGKKAGHVRNAEMGDYACKGGVEQALLVAFWDKKSKGTGHMIETAKKKGLIVKVFYY